MSDEFMGRRPPRFRPAQVPDNRNQKRTLRERMATIGHLARLAAQVWRTSPPLTIITIALRLVRALQPVVALFVGKLIIDEVVRQIGQPPPGPTLSDWFASGRLTHLAQYLALEFAVVVGTAPLPRATALVDAILGGLHPNPVSIELMGPAALLALTPFEPPDSQDRLERARRVAGSGAQLLPQLLG